MNKKRLLVILAVVLALGLNACQSNDDETHETSDPTTEVTTDATIFSTEAVTEPKETTTPTEAPTEAPTEVPTEAPTEAEAKECKHDYKSTVVAPTKTAQGYTLYECKNCDYSYKGNYTDKLPSDETEPSHQHSYSSNVTAPTCAANGYTTYTCACGHSYKDNETAALGHKYETETVAPTTEAQGYDLHTCNKCGASYKDNYTDKLPADDGSSDGEGGYYWFGNIKKPWNCSTQGHKTMGDPVVIQKATCVHDKVVEYTCVVVGCGATWTENNGGAGSVSHVMSAADQATVTKGDYFYHIKCGCGLGHNGNTRDEALVKFNAHAEKKEFTTCGTIMAEWEGHYHNFPSGTFNCAVCGEAIPFHESYVVCTCD